MIESFVDITYRGLSLGRRVKLSHVRPSTGYLETPAPMPVGTAIQIATDEGHAIEARVTAIHEQTGGSDKPPGMTVAPDLAGEALESWWRSRVAYPDEEVARPRTTSSPIVRPRAHAQADEAPAVVSPPVIAPDPEPAGGKTIAMAAVAAPPGVADDSGGKATMIMPAVDQALLEQLTRGSGEIEKLVRTTGEHEVIDDGKMTTVMDAIDPAALGLETGNSGSFAAASDDETDPGASDPGASDPGASGPVSTNGGDKKNGGKKKRKRR